MSLKVIGSGFGRTGTMSLKLALEQLGFAPCHHMVEAFKNPPSFAWWSDAADGKADWPKIFQGFQAAVDWPTATFYEALADFYPEAKVIHTERSPESWFASTQATIFARDFPETDPFGVMAHKVIGRLFDERLHDKDTLLRVYNAHNAHVREVIPPERLLVYHVKDGWEPLCRFLGVPAPEGPTPQVNSTEEFQRNVAQGVLNRDHPAEA